MGIASSSPIIESPIVRPIIFSTTSSSSTGQLLWTIRGNQTFVTSAIKIGGFGLLARLNNSQTLAVINPVEPTEQIIQEVKTLEKETNCPLKTIFSPGDWHHQHLLHWSASFPDAKVYVASHRVIKKQPKLAGKAIVVDQSNPVVPELSNDFDLIPFLGCRQPPWIVGGDKKGTDRVEHVVFHKATHLLFVTDHVFAPQKTGDPITPNTGGFAIQDVTAAASSARKVLSLQPKHLVFSHGTEQTFSLNNNGDDDNNNTSESKNETVAHLLKKAYMTHFLKGQS